MKTLKRKMTLAVFAGEILCATSAIAGATDPEWRGKLPRPICDERPVLER